MGELRGRLGEDRAAQEGLIWTHGTVETSSLELSWDSCSHGGRMMSTDSVRPLMAEKTAGSGIGCLVPLVERGG